MSKLVVNLTRIAVIQEVEDILETYSADPYQQAFSTSNSLEELITYVLSRISSCCVTADECRCSSKNSSLLSMVQREIGHRETVIRQGIEELCWIYQTRQPLLETTSYQVTSF